MDLTGEPQATPSKAFQIDLRFAARPFKLALVQAASFEDFDLDKYPSKGINRACATGLSCCVKFLSLVLWFYEESRESRHFWMLR